MIKKYFINFWVWWYGVQFVTVARSAFTFWSLFLARFNTVPMLVHLFVPMFQDQSAAGRVLSFFVRLFWAFTGIILQIAITIPLFIFVSVWVVLPFLCLFQIIQFFV